MSWPFFSRKSSKRRVKPEARQDWWQRMQADGTAGSLGIAAVFCLLASMIFMLREEVPAYRVHDWIGQDLFSRVDFTYHDPSLLEDARKQARDSTPPVYARTNVLKTIEDQLRDLPDRLAGRTLENIAPTLTEQFSFTSDALTTELDAAAITVFDQSRSQPEMRSSYDASVTAFAATLRSLVVIPAQDWTSEMTRQEMRNLRPQIMVTPAPDGSPSAYIELSRVFPNVANADLINEVRNAARTFPLAIQRQVTAFTLNHLMRQATFALDADATARVRAEAARKVPVSTGDVQVGQGELLLQGGRELTTENYRLLKAENDAYYAQLSTRGFWQRKVGMLALVVIVTAALGGYIRNYQPRVVRNHARGVAIATLLLSMLLLAQLAAIGTGPLYLFGVAPTILVAMILSIAYDRRFAQSVALTHGVLVTAALGEGIGFYLVIFIGTLTCCYLINDIRSRSRLIEIGGATALAMMLATLATGVIRMHPGEPFTYVGLNALYVGGAGIAVGFCVLGILPFIEKAFRITTGMTLLELADASQPLLRRLSVEAPGTYNHSLQVATLAEAACEAIGADSLLARVGAYYHDIGKINKADYFIENQVDGVNRHINLTPSVSLLIIIGHVKDGVEMAREYNLPTILIQFIQQHHGTTLVEYFYHQAVQQKDQLQPDHPDVSQEQYRYPGPKPRSREAGVVMLADACESATRALGEITPARIEALVHDIVMKRLLDGQFDECELTMREIELVERSLVKTLAGIYHGRIQYPSTAALTGSQQPPAGGAIRSA